MSRLSMRRIAVLVIASQLAACAGALVPTERVHINRAGTWRHRSYEKGGVALDGWTCGEQYQRAVAGVPEAEALMHDCAGDTQLYGGLMSGFILAPGLGAAAGELFDSGRARLFDIGAFVGVASFAAALLFGVRAAEERDDAVRAYNAALP